MTCRDSQLVAPPVTTEASVTTKNVSTVFSLKIAQYPFLALSVMLIPRMMGPEVYGQYAFLTSIIVITTSLTDLGIDGIFARFIPEFEIRGELTTVKRFFSNLLAFKIGIDIAASLALLPVLVLLFGNRFPLIYFLLIVAILLILDAGSVPFGLLFGLNKLGRYSLREPLRRGLSVTFIFVLYHVWGLTGAILSILLAELTLATLYFYWTRGYFSTVDLRLNFSFLKPFLAFGFTLYLSWVLTNFWQRLGNTLIQYITSSSREVAFFDMPNQIFLITSTFALSIIPSFTPIFTKLLLTGKEQKLINWSRLITKYTGVVCATAFGGYVIVGPDLIPLVIGRDYVGIFPNGVVLLLGLFPMILAQQGYAFSMVYRYPSRYLKALVCAFFTFFLMSLLLVPKYASMGASVATLVSCIVLAAIMYFYFPEKLHPCLSDGTRIIGLGAVFLGLAFLRGSFLTNCFLVFCFVGGHTLSLFGTKILTVAEIKDIFNALRYQPKVE